MVNDKVVDPVAKTAVQAAALPHADLEESLVEPADGLSAPHNPAYDKEEYYWLGSNTPPPPG